MILTRLLSAAVFLTSCAVVASPCAASTLLWSDDFDAPDSQLTESEQTNRYEGEFASQILPGNAKYILHIRDQQLELVGRDQEGRLRFHDADQPNVRLDFGGGDIGATIRQEGGLRIEFDWIPLYHGSALDDWIAISAGIPAALTCEPAVRVDHPTTDIGLKLRFDGRTEAYDNGSTTSGSASYPANDSKQKHVNVEYRFRSNEDGSPVLMTAWVDDQLVHRGLFTWHGHARQLHLELGAKAPARIDNLRLSTIPEASSLVFAGFAAFQFLRRGNRHRYRYDMSHRCAT